jgi:hypothetical protein
MRILLTMDVNIQGLFFRPRGSLKYRMKYGKNDNKK